MPSSHPTGDTIVNRVKSVTLKDSPIINEDTRQPFDNSSEPQQIFRDRLLKSEEFKFICGCGKKFKEKWELDQHKVDSFEY